MNPFSMLWIYPKSKDFYNGKKGEFLIKFPLLQNNTSDSLRGDSPIVTEGCKALARFYGSKVDP